MVIHAGRAQGPLLHIAVVAGRGDVHVRAGDVLGEQLVLAGVLARQRHGAALAGGFGKARVCDGCSGVGVDAEVGDRVVLGVIRRRFPRAVAKLQDR